MTVGEWRAYGPLAVSVVALVGGAVLHLADAGAVGDVAWALGVVVVLGPLALDVARSLRRGDVGVDLIALAAMAGALALGEFLAAVVVALMLSGGNALEAVANRRARRALTALLERAPTDARRRGPVGFEVVPVEVLVAGDEVLVRPGEVVPVDGVVTTVRAVVDESALTGEPLPVIHARGEPVRSGGTNAGEAFELHASRPASESTYAAIVRLVESAETQRAPFVRMADRFAIVMLVATLVLAAIGWALSGDPVRAVAVLVVATPCPLILAAPIALISGVAHAARSGVIVKGGGVIEHLAGVRTVLLDKTGTLTRGRPELERAIAADGHAEAEVLRLAASVEQYSVHVMAEAIVRGATARGVPLTAPTHVSEAPGDGIVGEVDGRRVAVGAPAYVRALGFRNGGDLREVAVPGEARVAVGVDGAVAGTLVLADRLRPDAATLVSRLRGAGVRHVAMASGDRQAAAEVIGMELGLDAVYGDQTPAGKLGVIRAIGQDPALRPLVMVGDGVNDAPALALADVGIALGSAGGTVAAETADAVIVDDRVDRVVDAIEISTRAVRIARQSVIAGIALSVLGMLAAAAGYLPPVAGALVQEGIDVAVILNALRALR
jgi:heavy metal translocating P-type ATPase